MLLDFANDLFFSGIIALPQKIQVPVEHEKTTVAEFLKDLHRQDAENVPATAPSFCAEAAVWGLSWLYSAIQLTVIRHLPEEGISEYLVPYTGAMEPSAIYSADISLRYLPQVSALIKKLAPNDKLLDFTDSVAAQWPFSSVGMELKTQPDLSAIIKHAALRQAYVDRIIAEKDLARVVDADINLLVSESLGMHQNLLWPEFKQISLTTNEY